MHLTCKFDSHLHLPVVKVRDQLTNSALAGIDENDSFLRVPSTAAPSRHQTAPLPLREDRVSCLLISCSSQKRIGSVVGAIDSACFSNFILHADSLM